jgi:hypothetical protein
MPASWSGAFPRATLLALLAANCTRPNPAYLIEQDAHAADQADAAIAVDAGSADLAGPDLAPPAVAPPPLDAAPDTSPEAALAAPIGIAFEDPSDSPVIAPSPGGTSFSDACPGTRALTALAGSTSAVILGLDSVQGRCADLALEGMGPFGITTGDSGTLPLRGELGPIRQSVVCPQRQVIVGFEAASGTWIDRVYVYCAPLTITETAGGLTLVVGAGVRLPTPVGSASLGAFTSSQCDPGKVAVGLRGAEGVAIDRLALHCARPRLIFP